jgi:SOUL heme-binding protein
MYSKLCRGYQGGSPRDAAVTLAGDAAGPLMKADERPSAARCVPLVVPKRGWRHINAVDGGVTMSGFFYYLLTFAESVTSVFGIRFPYEQPQYTVLEDLGQSVEVRQYEPRLAIEAAIDDPDQEKAAGEAFGLLFHYITGANRRDQKIAMTAPVQIESERIKMLSRSRQAAKRDG